MDALQKKAGSMGRKIASPCPDAVRLVSLWTLSTGCFLLLIFALDHAFDHFNLQIPCSPSGIILRWVEPTDAVALAKAAAEIAGWIGMLWCGAAQAAAAALALHLPRRYRRVRCALAYIALPLAIVGHSLYTRATVLLYAVDPGSLFAVIGWTQIIVFLAVFDLLCFLILLLGREVRTDCD